MQERRAAVVYADALRKLATAEQRLRLEQAARQRSELAIAVANERRNSANEKIKDETARQRVLEEEKKILVSALRSVWSLASIYRLQRCICG